ncbi:unnamed protein product [Leptidea sinapis]|uniref:Uncharacterized protein n=1 Tax=Leptidea sinapis TaxID=189913 RepID=A0A5E4R0K6_9NEOP|nr:unnamed protein product [Leptidea sinapis]
MNLLNNKSSKYLTVVGIYGYCCSSGNEHLSARWRKKMDWATQRPLPQITPQTVLKLNAIECGSSSTPRMTS